QLRGDGGVRSASPGARAPRRQGCGGQVAKAPGLRCPSRRAVRPAAHGPDRHGGPGPRPAGNSALPRGGVQRPGVLRQRGERDQVLRVRGPAGDGPSVRRRTTTGETEGEHAETAQAKRTAVRWAPTAPGATIARWSARDLL